MGTPQRINTSGSFSILCLISQNRALDQRELNKLGRNSLRRTSQKISLWVIGILTSGSNTRLKSGLVRSHQTHSSPQLSWAQITRYSSDASNRRGGRLLWVLSRRHIISYLFQEPIFCICYGLCLPSLLSKNVIKFCIITLELRGLWNMLCKWLTFALWELDFFLGLPF